MGFSAIARVTEERWITCKTKDLVQFGLQPGDELDISTTLCQEVHQNQEAIFIDDVQQDPTYCDHHTPKIYKINSYVSVPVYRKNGDFFGTLCALDSRPVKVDTPEIRGIFALLADLLSFHLQSVEQLEKITSKLESEQQVAVVRDQFISVLGHDLKNPVATTRMSAEIILKSTKEEMTRRQAELIKSTTYRMNSLVENVLDFARGQLGDGITLKLEENKSSLMKILGQVVQEVENNSLGREVHCDIRMQAPVVCDKDRIAQLLSNLLSNAATHGAPDHPIQVGISSDKDQFIIAVSNKGEKIPDELMDNMFEPFFKDQEQPQKKGLGLGLFIASEIAKAHGGIIEAISNEKETRFTFKMPSRELT